MQTDRFQHSARGQQPMCQPPLRLPPKHSGVGGGANDPQGLRIC